MCMYECTVYVYILYLHTYVRCYTHVRIILFYHTYVHTYGRIILCIINLSTYVRLLFLLMLCMQMMGDADEILMRSSDNQRPRSKPVHRRNKVRIHTYVCTFYVRIFVHDSLLHTYVCTCTIIRTYIRTYHDYEHCPWDNQALH